MKSNAYRPRIRAPRQVFVACTVAAMAVMVGLAQDADRAYPKPLPSAPVANPAAEVTTNALTPSVTNREAAAASSRNGAAQGGPPSSRSPSAATNAPAAAGGGSDKKSPTDKSESEIGFGEIRAAMLGMPDEKFEAYAKTLTGKKVTWEGRIRNISKQADGGAEWSVDMEEPEKPVSAGDVTFDLPSEEARDSGAASKTQFTGEIKTVSRTLDGIHVVLFGVRF